MHAFVCACLCVSLCLCACVCLCMRKYVCLRTRVYAFVYAIVYAFVYACVGPVMVGLVAFCDSRKQLTLAHQPLQGGLHSAKGEGYLIMLYTHTLSHSASSSATEIATHVRDWPMLIVLYFRPTSRNNSSWSRSARARSLAHSSASCCEEHIQEGQGACTM